MTKYDTTIGANFDIKTFFEFDVIYMWHIVMCIMKFNKDFPPSPTLDQKKK